MLAEEAASPDSGEPGTSTAAATTAEEPDQEPAGNKWTIEASAYGWITSSIKSDLRLGDLEVSSDVDFGDVLSVLDFGGFAHLEANNGKWGALTDLMYVHLSSDSTIKPRKGLFRPGIDVDTSMEQFIWEIAGYRRFGDEQLNFDLIAGGRYWNVSTETDIAFWDLDIGKSWIDPIVGGRLNIKVGDRSGLTFRGDIGGFGAGSDFTWNAVAMYRYSLSDSADIGLGYRILDVKHDSGDRELDIQMSGPIIGFAKRF